MAVKTVGMIVESRIAPFNLFGTDPTVRVSEVNEIVVRPAIAGSRTTTRPLSAGASDT